MDKFLFILVALAFCACGTENNLTFNSNDPDNMSLKESTLAKIANYRGAVPRFELVSMAINEFSINDTNKTTPLCFYKDTKYDNLKPKVITTRLNTPIPVGSGGPIQIAICKKQYIKKLTVYLKKDVLETREIGRMGISDNAKVFQLTPDLVDQPGFYTITYINENKTAIGEQSFIYQPLDLDGKIPNDTEEISSGVRLSIGQSILDDKFTNGIRTENSMAKYLLKKINSFKINEYIENESADPFSCDEIDEDYVRDLCENCANSVDGEKINHLCDIDVSDNEQSLGLWYELDTKISEIDFHVDETEAGIYLRTVKNRDNTHQSQLVFDVNNQPNSPPASHINGQLKIKAGYKFTFPCIGIGRFRWCPPSIAQSINISVPFKSNFSGRIVGTIGGPQPHLDFTSENITLHDLDMIPQIDNDEISIFNVILLALSAEEYTLTYIFNNYISAGLLAHFEGGIVNLLNKSLNKVLKKTIKEQIENTMNKFLENTVYNYTTDNIKSGYPALIGQNISFTFSATSNLRPIIEDENPNNGVPDNSFLNSVPSISILSSLDSNEDYNQFASGVGIYKDIPRFVSYSEGDSVQNIPDADRNFQLMFRNELTNGLLNRAWKHGAFIFPITPSRVDLIRKMLGKYFGFNLINISLQNPPIVYFNGDTSKPSNFFGVSHILFNLKVKPLLENKWKDVAFLLSFTANSINFSENNNFLYVPTPPTVTVGCDLIQGTANYTTDLALRQFCTVVRTTTGQQNTIVGSLTKEILNLLKFKIPTFPLEEIIDGSINPDYTGYFGYTISETYPNKDLYFKDNLTIDAQPAAVPNSSFFVAPSDQHTYDYGLNARCNASFKSVIFTEIH